MKKVLLGLALVVVGVAVARMGTAGYKTGQPYVTVVNTSSARYAYSTMGDARKSVDTVQYIGCEMSWNSSTGAHATCFAKNFSGLSIYCQSTEPVVMQMVGQLNTAGYLYFATAPGSGTCSVVRTESSSYNLPMTP